MKLSTLVFQHQNRYKFWNWDEVFTFTNLTPTKAKAIIDRKDYNLQDPFSALVYSHKNHELRALDNLYQNYCHPEKFELGYNDYGVSANFVIEAQSPTWQNFNHNQDWYWKQNWIYKYGQLLFIFPGIKNIYLSCSAALENSNHGSDIDLIIQTHNNWVWITKAYFAILSKVLKYYNFNFLLAGFYYISNQKTKLDTLKHHCTGNKIKIDFGLVFEDQKDLQNYYSNIERNIFIWSALKLESPNNNPIPPQGIFRYSQDDQFNECFSLGQTGSIIYKPKYNTTAFKLIQLLFLPTILIIAPFGITNYWYEQKHKNVYNKLVLWNIYSQYNLIY